MHAPRPKTDPLSILQMLDDDERHDLADKLGLKVFPKAQFHREIAAFSITTLLSEICDIRTPMMEMISEIGKFLTSKQARARSTVRFVLLDEARGLKVDFAGQMQAAIAECFDERALLKKSTDVSALVRRVELSVQCIVEETRPGAMRRETPRSRYYSALPGPQNKNLAERYKRTSHEYNPADRESLKQILEEVKSVTAICERLCAAQKIVEADEYLGTLRTVQRRTDQKFRQVSGSVAYEWPLPPIRIKAEVKTSAIEGIKLLKEALLALTIFNTNVDSLVDFFNLEIWQQRWRVYELWTLIRIFSLFVSLGFEVDLSERVHDSVWSLKFTKDDRPAAYLIKDSDRLQIFYQLYVKTEDAGNMPDIAVRYESGKYLLVVDPKQGRTYSRQDLSETAMRYQKDFTPLITIVHNYYLMEYECEEIDSRSNCLLISDVRPGGLGTKPFEEALRSHLPFRRAAEISIIALFDVSGSTERAGARLAASFSEHLSNLDAVPSEDSTVVFFNSAIAKTTPLRQVDPNTFKAIKREGGTDSGHALDFAMKAFRAMTIPRSLWIFSDGQLSMDVERIGSWLEREQIALEVFDSGLASAVTDVSRLVARVQGKITYIVDR